MRDDTDRGANEIRTGRIPSEHEVAEKLAYARDMNRPDAAMGAALGAAVGCRQSGRSALLAKARGFRKQASALEALAASIPDNFPHDADMALWELAMRA